MSATKSAAHFRAQLAYGSRKDVGYAPEVLDILRRDYHAAKMVEKIRRMVGDSEHLTAEQADGLVELIKAKVTA